MKSSSIAFSSDVDVTNIMSFPQDKLKWPYRKKRIDQRNEDVPATAEKSNLEMIQPLLKWHKWCLCHGLCWEILFPHGLGLRGKFLSRKL